MRRFIIFTIGSTLLITTSIWAADLTIPNTFTAGTPAKASDVNANFSAVKTAIDNNSTKINVMESFQNSPAKFIENNSGFGQIAQNSWAWSPPLVVTPKKDGLIVVHFGFRDDIYAGYPTHGISVNTTGIQPANNLNSFNRIIEERESYGTEYVFNVVPNTTYYIYYGVTNKYTDPTNSTYYYILAAFHSSSGL